MTRFQYFVLSLLCALSAMVGGMYFEALVQKPISDNGFWAVVQALRLALLVLQNLIAGILTLSALIAGLNAKEDEEQKWIA